MNMRGTLLAAALMAIIGYLAIQLADSNMGIDRELAQAIGEVQP